MVAVRPRVIGDESGGSVAWQVYLIANKKCT